MNLHQTPEEIIKAATPAQKILWNYIFLNFGERIGITQLYYQGAIAGSEFLTYTLGKHYLALNVFFSGAGAASGANNLISLYDRANAINGYINNQTSLFDPVAAANEYGQFSYMTEALHFSRLIINNWTYIRFIGYKISY